MRPVTRFLIAVVAAALSMNLVIRFGVSWLGPEIAASLANAVGAEVLWLIGWPPARTGGFGRRDVIDGGIAFVVVFVLSYAFYLAR